jgi:hypothetical protein
VSDDFPNNVAIEDAHGATRECNMVGGQIRWGHGDRGVWI